jgi:S-adenosylmethionine:tRNA ribosyltransferase-isomerase
MTGMTCLTNLNKIKELKIDDFDLKQYDYNLPPEMIAQYPARERDLSKLLIYKDNIISSDIFRNIDQYLPSDSLLVFNNTRVIRARIIFRKETGAAIEVLCLEPLAPAEYGLSFSSKDPVEWKCIIGNLKKWKEGIIQTYYTFNGKQYELKAKRVQQEGDAWRIRFEWGSSGISFGELIDSAGQLPLPPYLERETEPDDLNRYQTVYSRIKGSVAAPTAGLHFTGPMVERLKAGRMATAEVTLHVGAGTFKPVKSGSISEHEMHCEHFSVSRETIETLTEYEGKIIPVGTTTVRTLESLYWLGVKLMKHPLIKIKELSLGQWDAYDSDSNITPSESFTSILKFMMANELLQLNASTSIMIIPGYEFRIIKGMITNFHQPMSTLLLLISALVKESWKEIYRYALDNDFRFLSYGDCTLLFRKEKEND